MTSRTLAADLLDHACGQLAKAARRHVREGMGPASAASAAIRETRALFPPDWRIGVQGDDSEDAVEVWEVEHKRSIPCARISRDPVPEPGFRFTDNQRDALGLMIQSPRRTSSFYPASLRRTLLKLVEKGLAQVFINDPYQRAKHSEYTATAEGKAAYYAAIGDL
jgi:hypothetical protein